MTATRRQQTGQVITVPRRVLRALRYVNGELTRASEAIIRSARASRPQPRIQAPGNGQIHPGAADRADRAA